MGLEERIDQLTGEIGQSNDILVPIEVTGQQDRAAATPMDQRDDVLNARCIVVLEQPQLPGDERIARPCTRAVGIERALQNGVGRALQLLR